MPSNNPDSGVYAVLLSRAINVHLSKKSFSVFFVITFPSCSLHVINAFRTTGNTPFLISRAIGGCGNHLSIDSCHEAPLSIWIFIFQSGKTEVGTISRTSPSVIMKVSRSLPKSNWRGVFTMLRSIPKSRMVYKRASGNHTLSWACL
jgi:hypothetical protein